MQPALPRYPIYVISKGRYANALTAKFLMADGVPFHIVVEPQEQEQYAAVVGRERVLMLPFSNLGLGGIPARNWVWEHAKAAGHKRHWILDDNIAWISRRFKLKRVRCDSGVAFAACEDFVERYQNVAIAGMNYEMFVPDSERIPAFYLNTRVYSCLLISNDLPYRWRGRYNEDTDLCLMALSSGLCTVLFNVFMIWKMRTMGMKGGNTDELYKGNGRLKMAKSLERAWPGVVETKRRYGRPQHVIKNAWRKFDTPLKRRTDIDWSKIQGTNEYGMKLVQVKPEIKSEALRKMVAEYGNSPTIPQEAEA